MCFGEEVNHVEQEEIQEIKKEEVKAIEDDVGKSSSSLFSSSEDEDQPDQEKSGLRSEETKEVEMTTEPFRDTFEFWIPHVFRDEPSKIDLKSNPFHHKEAKISRDIFERGLVMAVISPNKNVIQLVLFHLTQENDLVWYIDRRQMSLQVENIISLKARKFEMNSKEYSGLGKFA